MTRYAYYDVPPTGAVIGWIDTGEFDYPSLPDQARLLELTDAEWDSRLSNPSGWAVQNGILVSYKPPVVPPTLPEQAQAMLISPVTVQSAAVPDLDGDYLNNDSVRGQITSIASSINAGLGLPGGGSTFNWPSADGTMRMWPAPQFTSYAQAIMNFVYACAQVMQGHSDTLPSTTLTIP